MFSVSSVGSPGSKIESFAQGNPIYDFWIAVNQPDAVKTNGKNIIFTETAAWGWNSDTKVLYERDCYIHTLNAIVQHRNKGPHIVEGTPGIGKSMFIFYFIYKLVLQARELNDKIPTFLIVGRTGNQYFLGVDNDGSAVVHRPISSITPDYIITDTVGISEAHCSLKYIHVTSINNIEMKVVLKVMMDISGSTIFMPVFSLEEYLDCDGGDPARNNLLRFYFDVFGGSLRNCRFADRIAGTESHVSNIFILVREQMDSFFGSAKMADIDQTTWDNAALALTIMLQHPTMGMNESGDVKPEEISRSVIFHSSYSVNGAISFPASRFMRHLAGHICNDNKNNILHRLKNVIGASGAGYVHEHDAHQYRLKHLGTKPGIALWNLEGKSVRKLYLPINRVVRIRSVRDIEHLEPGDYGLPTTCNFPFLDAVMKPNYLFQDTIAERHDTLAQIPQILAALGKRKSCTATVMLINTLGTENFSKFKKNSNAALVSFTQWKTRMEAHTDDVVDLNTHEPLNVMEETKKKDKKREAVQESEVQNKKAKK